MPLIFHSYHFDLASRAPNSGSAKRFKATQVEIFYSNVGHRWTLYKGTEK